MQETLVIHNHLLSGIHYSVHPQRHAILTHASRGQKENGTPRAFETLFFEGVRDVANFVVRGLAENATMLPVKSEIK